MFKSILVNWKTSLLGLLAGIGLAAPELTKLLSSGEQVTWSRLLMALALAALGLMARDHNVTSEASGASAPPLPPGQIDVTAFTGRNPAKPLSILLLLSLALISGGWSCAPQSTQAQAITGHMEASAVNYARNRDKVDEGFLSMYRQMAQSKADQLADDSIRAETGADGKANAQNLKIILEKKADHYANIERQVIAMRGKVIECDVDMTNLLEYNAGLQKYFAQRTSTAAMLNASGEQVIGMLGDFLGKKK